MLSVYFDDSSKVGDHEIVLMSGLISSATQWECLESEWKATLDELGIRIPFHMADFEARKKSPWCDLGPADRIKLINRLTGIMARRVKARVYTALVVPELRSLVVERADKRLGCTLCAFGCASRISEWAMSYGESKPVAYMFEGGTEGQGEAFAAFSQIMKKKHPVISLIGSRTLDDKRQPQLQAADVWAYESRKFIDRQYRREPRPMRRSLIRLLDIPDGRGFIIGGKALIEMTAALREGRAIATDVHPIEFSHLRVPAFEHVGDSLRR